MSAPCARAGRAHPPTVFDRVRDRVLRIMAPCTVEPRLLEIGNGGGASSAGCAPATRWPGAFRRRLHDEHELMDARRVRIGTRGGDGGPQTRADAGLINRVL